MTEQELEAEWRVIYETRLGILCEERQPTEEQLNIATEEADEWFNREIGVLRL